MCCTDKTRLLSTKGARKYQKCVEISVRGGTYASSHYSIISKDKMRLINYRITM